jgi:hypothetical protein
MRIAFPRSKPLQESFAGIVDASSFDDHGSGVMSRGKVMNKGRLPLGTVREVSG